MIAVNVQSHSLPGTANVALPLDRIREVFAAAGISLNVAQGSPVAQPVGGIFEAGSVASLLQVLGPQAPDSTIHLLISDRRSVDGALISGELLDTDSRRLVIVYTQSNYIANNGESALAETCIHELGHALNLTHDSVVSPDQPYYYHSAMEQSGDRILGAIPQSWTSCAVESNSLAGKWHVDPLTFEPAAPQSGCLPFAWVARKQIQDFSNAAELLPGPGRSFIGLNVEDEMQTSGALNVSAEHDHYVQWGVLSLCVRMKLPRSRGHRASALFGPQYGNLAIEIRRPDGQRYVHRPRTLCCVDEHEAPDNALSMTAPFCTLRGPGGTVLDSAGTYKVRASTPHLGLQSKWIEIDVEPRRASSVLANETVRRSLATGGVLSGRTRSVIRNAVKGDRTMEPQTRAYLAMALSRGRCTPSEKVQLLRIAGHQRAPHEMRLATLRACIKDKMQEVVRLKRRAVREMVNRALPESAEDGTFDRIMGDVSYGLQTA